MRPDPAPRPASKWRCPLTPDGAGHRRVWHRALATVDRAFDHEPFWAELFSGVGAVACGVAELRDERWKLLASLNNHRHALANARQMVTALERKLGQEPTVWQPLEEP